jgi:hypothetical protein
VVRAALAAVDERIRDVLRGVTLADLCRESPAAQAGRYGLALIGEGADA